tara:strand:- start:147 stop:311 length:165 start_codon:yes stop_codon:yes gene_type:complete
MHCSKSVIGSVKSLCWKNKEKRIAKIGKRKRKDKNDLFFIVFIFYNNEGIKPPK